MYIIKNIVVHHSYLWCTFSFIHATFVHMYDAEVRYMSTCTIKLHVVLIHNVPRDL